MAEKRMFSKQIIDSDAFLDMPLSSQALYFHLNMRADDDGFINNPKKIQRMVLCSEGDFEMLIAKRFVIPFESGVCVIKHWLIHNYIRKDTYKGTPYTEEKAMLCTKDNNSYTLDTSLRLCDEAVDETSRRLDKNSIDKNSIDDIDNSKKEKKIYMNLTFIDDVIEKVKITEAQYANLLSKFSKELLHSQIISLDNYIVNGKGSKYKDHYRALNTWCNKNKDTRKQEKQYKSVEDTFVY